ncbi:MAG: protein-glutamate O-methyltransferase CheR [Oscillospiraceae bacterium]|nr:protein-glutamate O-methyltransferase CheR [Oscillospiraceae bacterium]
MNMSIGDKDFIRLRDYMHDHFGINLEKKRTLIEGRLGNTIAQEGFDGFTDFLDDAFADKTGHKIDTLISKLTTNYTYFYREDTHYNFMVDIALPEWTSKIKNNDLRIWSAGCSSGEEPYTTAMVLNEYFGSSKASWDSKILATDLSPRVLKIAKDAVYPEEHLEKLPAGWDRKYFDKRKNQHDEVEYAIKPFLKNEVIFGQFNLMQPFTRFKKKFHIIFCRNVMIYFNNATKAELTDKYFDALEPGGYLFIGMSETLSGINPRFQQIKPAIYRKQ